MIGITEGELKAFLKDCFVKSFKRQVTLSRPDVVPNEIFFILQGMLRVG